MQNIRLGQTRYNERAGAFEARVDVVRNGVTFRYPVRVAAPQDADPRWVSDALVRHALTLSDTPTLH